MNLIENLYAIVALVCIHFNDIKFVETAENFKKLQCAGLLVGFFLIPIISTLLTYATSNSSDKFEAIKNAFITNLIGFAGAAIYIVVFSWVIKFLSTYSRTWYDVVLADFIIFWLTKILIMQIFSQMPIAIRIFSFNSPENYVKLVRYKYLLLICLFLLLIFVAPFDLLSNFVDIFFVSCFFVLSFKIAKKIKKI